LILANRGVADSSHRNGQGVRHTIQVSDLNGTYETRVVDRDTDPAVGPDPVTSSGSPIELTINGYGMATIVQQ
jgi:hypothetical protein